MTLRARHRVRFLSVLSLAVAAAAILSLAAPIAPAAAAAVASPAPAPPPSRIDTVVLEVGKAQRALRTLSARFTQRKQVGLLQGTQESSGHLYFHAPDTLLWVYTEPKPILMLIEKDRLTTYHPDLKRADVADVGRYQKGVFKFLGGEAASPKTLRRYFRVSLTEDRTEAPYFFDLVPTARRVKRRVSGLRVWVDKNLALPVKVEYTEPDGDSTLYELTDLRVNEPIPAERFVLELPPDVKIQRITVGSRRNPD